MRKHVAEARVGRLATVAPDGQPHIVPCCFVLRGDTVYSAVDGKPKSTRALRRLENIRANAPPRCSSTSTTTIGNELWWVRRRCDGRRVEREDDPGAGVRSRGRAAPRQVRAVPRGGADRAGGRARYRAVARLAVARGRLDASAGGRRAVRVTRAPSRGRGQHRHDEAEHQHDECFAVPAFVGEPDDFVGEAWRTSCTHRRNRCPGSDGACSQARGTARTP